VQFLVGGKQHVFETVVEQPVVDVAVDDFIPEGVVLDAVLVAHDDHGTLCPGHHHVGAVAVAQEAHVALVVAAH